MPTSNFRRSFTCSSRSGGRAPVAHGPVARGWGPNSASKRNRSGLSNHKCSTILSDPAVSCWICDKWDGSTAWSRIAEGVCAQTEPEIHDSHRHDDEGVTRTFARMLTLEGFQVRTAFNAETGLRPPRASRTIILDLRMPLGRRPGVPQAAPVSDSQRITHARRHRHGDYFLDDAVADELLRSAPSCDSNRCGSRTWSPAATARGRTDPIGEPVSGRRDACRDAGLGVTGRPVLAKREVAALFAARSPNARPGDSGHSAARQRIGSTPRFCFRLCCSEHINQVRFCGRREPHRESPADGSRSAVRRFIAAPPSSYHRASRRNWRAVR